eukprot:TRINITY_DN12378_c0_g1_i11.p2 TRINITY_DN12378_c0_g1~~TRINITY_DN12378_c0_g1_i11.p2  ORF type:complete len:632 (+),score=153.04 TRINITY_DN12378_c0_g1_i11:146-1897(+)
MPLEHFRGMMRFRNPRLSELNIRLLFCALNGSESGAMNLREFYNFYEHEGLRWKRVASAEEKAKDHDRYESTLSACQLAFDRCRDAIRTLVTNRYFENVVDLVILLNVILIFFWSASADQHQGQSGSYYHTSGIDIGFLCFYWLETLLKMTGLGLPKYLRGGWNIFDVFINTMSLLGLVLEVKLTIFVALRQLRVLRLFKVKERFRQVLGTMFSLVPLLSSFLLVLFLVYYSFAIVGISTFAGKVTVGCCGDYYSNTTAIDRYYLNNFDNVFNAYITLFELMVVNNWFVIMNGFVAATNSLSRIYFMLFYIITVNIVLNVVIAFILETFLSRMSYQRSLAERGKDEETETLKVFLRHADVAEYYDPSKLAKYCSMLENEWFEYHGSRPKDMYDCQLMLFAEEIQLWCHDDEVLVSCLLPMQQAIARKRNSRARGPATATLSDAYKRDRQLGCYDPDVRDTRHLVVYQNLLGQGIHRLPWVLPSQEVERMHRIVEAMTQSRMPNSAWPTARAINLLASKLRSKPADAVALDVEAIRTSSENGHALKVLHDEESDAGQVDLQVHELANSIRRLSVAQRNSLISML